MSRNRKKRSKNQSKNQKMILYHPPALKNRNVKWSTRLRFLQTAASLQVNFSETQVMNTVIVAATAITGYQLFSSARIKFIEMWAMSAVGGVPQTVTCTFNGLGIGDAFTSTDTSIGIEPAHVKVKPRKLSLAAMFFSSSGNILFTLGGPANTIIDVGIEFVYDWTSSNAATGALVGATPGATYLRGLDGLPTSMTGYPSQGGVVNI